MLLSMVLELRPVRSGVMPSCTLSHCNGSVPGISGASGQRDVMGAWVSTLAKESRFRSMQVVSIGSTLVEVDILARAVRKLALAWTQ